MILSPIILQKLSPPSPATELGLFSQNDGPD